MKPPAAAEDDLASAGSWLESNPTLVERWLRERATPELRQRVHQAVLAAGPIARRTSASTDLFQLWLATSPGKAEQNVRSRRELEAMEESELFMELIRDVANELDIDVLCHKILRNVSLLTHADRGSLFLARGHGDGRYLVAKLFDVRYDTELEEAIKQARSEEIRIPFGVGIAGTVAQNKSLINIKDAYNVSSKHKSHLSFIHSVKLQFHIIILYAWHVHSRTSIGVCVQRYFLAHLNAVSSHSHKH